MPALYRCGVSRNVIRYIRPVLFKMKRKWGCTMKKLLIVVLSLLLLLAVAGAQAEDVTVYVTGAYRQTSAREMLQMINDFRTGGDAWYWDSTDTVKVETGVLNPLVYDYGLEQVAMQRAIEAAVSFSHHRPDSSDNSSCFSAFSLSEGNYTNYGENLAAGSSTTAGAFTQWMEENDPYLFQGHRRNMLSSGYNCIGIAHVIYNGYHYWVQELGYSSAPVTAETPAPEESRRMAVNINPELSADAGGIVLVSASNQSLQVFSSGSLPAVSFYMRDTWPENGNSMIVAEGLDGSLWTSVSDPAKLSLEGNQLHALGVGSVVLEGKVLGHDIRSTVEIIPEDLSGAAVVISEPEKLIYTGESITPLVTVTTAGGKELLQDTDYSVGCQDNINASDSASVVVTGIGNYTGSVSAPFTILPAPLNVGSFSAPDPQVYSGEPITPPISGVFGSQQLTEGRDFTVEWSSNVNVGSATATVTGIGNFTGTVQLDMSIGPKSIIGAAVTLENAQLPWSGTEQRVNIAGITVDGLSLTADDYSLTGDLGTNTGDYVVTVTGKGNFKDTVTADWKIVKAPIAGATISAIEDQAYTGKALKPKLTLELNGKVLRLGKDYTATYKNNKAIGKATVTITGKGNLTGKKTVKFSIVPQKAAILKLAAGKKSLTVKWKADGSITGYEIEYSLKKSFQGAKKITVSKAKAEKHQITGLKAKKVYYVRIRSYKKVKGQKYYSDWSKVLNIKVK